MSRLLYLKEFVSDVLRKNPVKRNIIPECIQLSASDCGSCTLKSILDGFRTAANYDALRSLCETNTDGTSFDNLEELASDLGLDNVKTIVMPDDLLSPQSRHVPAIAVIRLPSGFAHFVVLWRCYSNWVQIMDPAVGRRWLKKKEFLEMLYVHSMEVEHGWWLSWYKGDESNRAALESALQYIGYESGDAIAKSREVFQLINWIEVASVKAATVLTKSLIEERQLSQGKQAIAVFEKLCDHAAASVRNETPLIPEKYWPAVNITGEDREIKLRGTPIITIRGMTDRGNYSDESESLNSPVDGVRRSRASIKDVFDKQDGKLTDFVKRNLPINPVAALISFFTLVAILVALESFAEPMIFKTVLEVSPNNGYGSLVTLKAFALLVCTASIGALASYLVRVNLTKSTNHLEVSLREQLFLKLKKLKPIYIKTRTTSDLCDRLYFLQHLNGIPNLMMSAWASIATVIISAAGIFILTPQHSALIAIAVGACIATPFLVYGLLNESENRLRISNTSATGVFLDSIFGANAILAHRAKDNALALYDELLGKWLRQSFKHTRLVVAITAVQEVFALCLLIMVVWAWGRTGELSLAFFISFIWAMIIPQACLTFAHTIMAMPSIAITLRRVKEVLEGHEAIHAESTSKTDSQFESLTFKNVYLSNSKKNVLVDINLTIGIGEHIAIVGTSGSGKSSLAELILGLSEYSAGTISFGNRTVSSGEAVFPRKDIVWIDPTVCIWNESVLFNIKYGNENPSNDDLLNAIRLSRLDKIIDRLPNALDTLIGKGGHALSGGELQRIRIARSLVRSTADFVIMDEAFRGLDTSERKYLLNTCREMWAGAGLLYFTHDISHALSFPRVIVLEQGKIVEDGSPELLKEANTKFRSMLDTERRVSEKLASKSFLKWSINSSLLSVESHLDN